MNRAGSQRRNESPEMLKTVKNGRAENEGTLPYEYEGCEFFPYFEYMG